MMDTRWIECGCWSSDHAIRVSVDDEEVWVEASLAPYAPLWKRIWLAAKYVATGKFQSMWFGWSLTKWNQQMVEEYLELIKAKGQGK